MRQSIIEAIIKNSQNHPDKTAVVIGDDQISYKSFVDRIIIKKEELEDKGVVIGDRVILAAVPNIDYLAFYFAIHLIGAIAVPVDKAATIQTISDVIEDVQPSCIMLNESIGTSDYEETAEHDDIQLPESKSVADIIYTTGTTGQAKGVMLTHANMIAGAKNVIHGGNVQKEEVCLLPVPLHHAYGLTTMRAIFYIGATLVLQDGFASLKKTHKNIHQNRCTRAYLIPAAIPLLIRQTADNLPALLGILNKLEFCTAPLNAHYRKLLNEILPKVTVYNSYGATEAARSIYMNVSENMDRCEAVGKPVEGVKVRIADPDCPEKTLAIHQVGRLVISGDMVMAGYYQRPDISSQVIVGSELLMGDLGYMDEAGYIYVLGREQDIMNIGGEKVSPQEIEEVVLGSGLVQECACLAEKDERQVLGDIPVLYVVYKNAGDNQGKALSLFIKEHIEKYKRPGRIVKVDVLPRNYMGKLDRNRLRECLWENGHAGKI